MSFKLRNNSCHVKCPKGNSKHHALRSDSNLALQYPADLNRFELQNQGLGANSNVGTKM